MIDESIRTELMKQVEQLSLPLQHRVLDYASNLAKESSAEDSGKDFLALSGTLDPQDAAEMLQAVEEGCEEIDLDGW